MAKVLVIDDEVPVRKYLYKILVHQGHEAFSAEDGLSGLEIFKRKEPDIILLDIIMPGMNGIQVLRRINEHSKDTVVIIMTGQGSLENAIEALREGAYDYIIKPFTYADLELSIRRAMERTNTMKMLNERTKKLEEAYAYINNIIRSMNDTLMVLSPDGRIKMANRAACDLLEYEERELTEHDCNTILAERILEKEKFLELTKDGHTDKFDMLFVTKSGAHVPVDLVSSPIKDSEENISGILWIARDMRELKRLFEKEKKLVAAEAVAETERIRSQELEKAYRDLQETQILLVQVGKMAAVGQLAAGVAHEINNPLSSVLTHSKLLQRKLKRSELENHEALTKFPEYIELIVEGAVRCERIVKDLLIFSRGDEEERLVEVKEVIEKTLSLVSNQLSLGKIVVKKEFAGDPGKVMGRFNRLQQVFINIILNAYQFMPEGGEISISTHRGLEKKYVEIWISDTGPGIPKENLNKIFDPFFTTVRASGELQFGAGLGLSIAYRIVNEHGGTITAENAPVAGARFIVKLPVQA